MARKGPLPLLMLLAAMTAWGAAAGGASGAPTDRPTYLTEWLPRQIPLHGAVEVDIRATSGHIEVVAGAEGRVLVQGTIKTTAHEMEAAKMGARASSIKTTTQGDNKLFIETVQAQVPHVNVAVELRVEVPPRATVRIRTHEAAIDAKSLAGPLDIKTKSGAVRVELAGPATIHAESMHGQIEQNVGLQVSGRGGRMTADGHIGGGGPAVSLQTGQGRVVVHASAPMQVR